MSTIRTLHQDARETVVGIDLGLRNLLVAAPAASTADTLSIDGRPSWRLYEECAQRNGADADRYADLFDARFRQVADRLVTFAARQGTQTVAVESFGTPDRSLGELAADGAKADAWIKARLGEHIRRVAAREGYRVVSVFPGGSSTTCHACGREGERSGETFRCENEACSVSERDADANAAAVIGRRAREGRQIVGEING